MLNNLSRMSLVGGLWFATLAIAVAASVAMGAALSTSALLLVLGIAPAIVMIFVGGPEPAPTVAEIIYAVDSKQGR